MEQDRKPLSWYWKATSNSCSNLKNVSCFQIIIYDAQIIVSQKKYNLLFNQDEIGISEDEFDDLQSLFQVQNLCRHIAVISPTNPTNI